MTDRQLINTVYLHLGRCQPDVRRPDNWSVRPSGQPGVTMWVDLTGDKKARIGQQTRADLVEAQYGLFNIWTTLAALTEP